jgi:class 3 adenylate cyclase
MDDAGITRKLAVILAADVAGYSRLMAADEEGTLAALNARRQVIDELIARHRGRIFTTAGDSVMPEFASAVEAVRCAAAIQREIARRNADPPEPRRSSGVVEDHAQSVPVTGAHPADAVPHVDAVDAARAAHRPMMHGKDHAGALA